MDEILARIDALAEKIAQSAVKYGPDAFNLATSVYQAKAIAGLVEPFGFLLAATVAFYFAFRPALKAAIWGFDNSFQKGTETPAIGGGVVAVFSGVAIAFLGVNGALGLFSKTLNPLYWMAAFDGKFALAASVLKAI